MKFSEEQWSQFDRLERSALFDRLRRLSAAERPGAVPDDGVGIRDGLLSDLAGRDLHEATVADLFFLSFDLGRPITREPAFASAVDDLLGRNFPFEEIVSSIAGSRRRQLALG